MNKIFLMGRFTKDPEIRSTKEGTSVANFTIAVDRAGRDETTDFFNCTAYGRQADFAERFCHKGIKMVVIGRLQFDKYTNKDGQPVTAAKVITENLEFCEKKSEAEPAKQDAFMNAVEEELPFNF